MTMQRLTEAFPLRGVARRYLLASIAWLVLVTQASSFAHLLLVRHAVCPQHGELVHVGEDEGPPSVDSALPSEQDSGGSAIRAGHGATEEHVHCLLAMHRRQTPVVPRSAFTIAPARVAEIRVLTLGSSPRPALVALFSLAPKTSPPVV